MAGALVALGSALAIALSAVIARSLTVFITPRPLQTMRAWVGALFLFIVVPIIGKAGEVFAVTPQLIGYMAASAIIGAALGDTLYMKTLSMVEASRSFPTVRGTQILSTMIVASLLFSEEITWATALGACLIMGGVYLAAFARTQERRGAPARTAVPIKNWIFLAIGAGLCWTCSFSFMKGVLLEVDPIVAQTFRLPAAALILTAMSLQGGEGKKLRIWEYKRKTILLVVLCGILSYGMGVILELYAITFAGMAKAAVLTSWTPLFILFLSALFLKERITPRLVFGTLLCSGGTAILMVL